MPNSTAGMVIGKAGVYIRQIKEDSGAYVQISQKSKDLNLPERCVTIAGMHTQESYHLSSHVDNTNVRLMYILELLTR